MDIKPVAAEPTDDERAAVDALIGPPGSSWHGGARHARDAHVAISPRESGLGRPMLLPALEAIQARMGWISEGALGYVCERLDVPPADAWGVATFYALLGTTPRPKRVVHVCDDIACRTRGARAIVEKLERAHPPLAHEPGGDHVVIDDGATNWMHSPCLGMCDMAPAALVMEAGTRTVEYSIGGATLESLQHLLGGRANASSSAA